MKKALIILLAVAFAIPSFSQEKTTSVASEKNVFKINTLCLILGTGSVFYEHKLSDAMSGQLGVAYLNYKISGTKFTGLILTPEVRFYTKKNAIDGMYVAPYVRYQNYSLSDNTAKGTLSSIGGGLLLGRQWIKASGFTMDLFFGGHFGSASVKATEGDATTLDTKLFSGFGFRVGFALGFAF
jgi:Protein of unknown function (DUF3575)